MMYPQKRSHKGFNSDLPIDQAETTVTGSPRAVHRKYAEEKTNAWKSIVSSLP